MRYFKSLKVFATAALLVIGAAGLQAASAFTAEEIAASSSMGELETPPKPVRQTQPNLPPELQGLKASVQIGFLIDETGRVVKPRIVQSSNDSFNDVAMRCVRNWEFEPGKKGGKAVSVRVVVPLRFK
jgi:periplasmic protein TonB